MITNVTVCSFSSVLVRISLQPKVDGRGYNNFEGIRGSPGKFSSSSYGHKRGQECTTIFPSRFVTKASKFRGMSYFVTLVYNKSGGYTIFV